MTVRHAALLTVGSLLLSCGSHSADTPPATKVVGQLTVETGAFDVPAGDVFECFYTSVSTDHEVSVTRATAVQQAGGHHVTVYYADTPKPVGHHPCVDAEMTAWHQVAAAAGKEGTSTGFSLPDGLAFRIPAGKQIVVQSHYINTTGKTQQANDRISIELVDPATVRAHANLFIGADLGFTIPAKSKFTHTTTCVVDQDLQVATLFGHMHELGTHYKLEIVDDAGKSLSTLYEKDWQPEFTSHTPENRFSYDHPLVIKEGTRLRQSCTWDNPNDVTVAHPREMCLALLFYFPDNGSPICFMSE